MRWFTGLALSLLLAGPTLAAERAIIILDGSGSMWAQIDGEARISIARETLKDVLKSVPDDLELGLMSYGHREKGACSDIEMLVEPAAGTAEAIGKAAAGINPKGKTPLSDAVRMAAEDLHFTEDKATVILITDGLETCEADPCALATELDKQGVDFTTHVVGFGLTEEEGHQVACLAENTGGEYFQASDGKGLGDALRSTVAQAAVEEPAPAEPAALDVNLDPELVLAEGGEQPTDSDVSVSWTLHIAKADGSEGDYVRTEYGVDWKAGIEPGDYLLTAAVDDVKVTVPVSLTADTLAEPLLTLNAGKLSVQPFAAEGEPVNDGAAVTFAFADGEQTTNYGAVSRFVPAGKVDVTVKIGNGQATESIEVPAGGEVSRDIVLGVGHVVFNAFYVEGMRVEESGLSVQVVGAKKDIQGNREDFGYGYGPDLAYDLPAGDYVAIVELQGARVETPFSVTSGASFGVDSLLDAGVLALSLPNGDSIEILAAKKDIQGNRTSFGYDYGEAVQKTLPAGDYVAVTQVQGSDDRTETPFTIIAGERTEITVQ